MESNLPAGLAAVKPPYWCQSFDPDGSWTLNGTYRLPDGLGLHVTVNRVQDADAPRLEATLTCIERDREDSPVLPVASATLPDFDPVQTPFNAAMAHCDPVLVDWEVNEISVFDPQRYWQFAAEHAATLQAELAEQDADFPADASDDGDDDRWEEAPAPDCVTSNAVDDAFQALNAAISALVMLHAEVETGRICEETRAGVLRLAGLAAAQILNPVERADIDRAAMALADRLARHVPVAH
jgi:hypothetical protein